MFTKQTWPSNSEQTDREWPVRKGCGLELGLCSGLNTITHISFIYSMIQPRYDYFLSILQSKITSSWQVLCRNAGLCARTCQDLVIFTARTLTRKTHNFMLKAHSLTASSPIWEKALDKSKCEKTLFSPTRFHDFRLSFWL